ncbi:MAG: Phosphoglycerate mutase, partial [Candidatus Azambacteria bacterium GW2011_GWE2_46_45]
MAHIILVRHGETEANRLGIYQGKITDHFLNLTGNRQAEAVAKTLKDFQIEKIYSSTSMRAIETAENINDYHEKSIFATGKLLEIDHGLFDGKTLEQVKAKYPKILETWWNHPEKVKFPKGETLKGAHRRVTQFINDVINDMTRKIRSGNDSGNVLVVSHGGAITLMLMSILEIPLRNFRKFPRISNTGVTLIKVTEKGPSIIAV